MNEQIIVVPKLTIKIVTGETCYPGENGFSAHYAETSPNNPEIEDILTTAHQNKDKITLRCAAVDAIGSISKIRTEDPNVYVLWIDDIVYRKPNRK